ncbi:hypothetical protein Tco_0788797 [Tanacetum coccineum]
MADVRLLGVQCGEEVRGDDGVVGDDGAGVVEVVWCGMAAAVTRGWKSQPEKFSSGGGGGRPLAENVERGREDGEYSGCSKHMTWVKQYLHRYSKESGHKVVFGDNSSSDTEGYGSVNCNGITFTKVAYVNGLKHNLISISQLCDANFMLHPQNLIPQSSGPTEHVADEVVHKERGGSLVRVATTASSLEAEQDSRNINKTRSKATPNEAGSQGTTSGGNTLQSGEDSLNLKKLMELCTNLQTRVLDLETIKITQANEIASLKRGVKKLLNRKIGQELIGLKGEEYMLIYADEDITLVNDQDYADMFDVITLTGDEVLAESEVAVKDVNLSVDEVTLAQALAALKSAKVQEKGDVIEEPSIPVSAASTKVSAATTTITATIPTPRKGIVITELEEPVKPKKKDIIRLDEEIALKLQAKFDEEERLAREKDEANVALTEEWDDIQAKVEQRRKHFAAKRAEEKRNKPPTQAQQRKSMCTYLKNMEGKKPKDLKNKSFDSIQKMFDRAFKRVNTFVDFRTDLVEGSSKRAGTELEQEVTKKQKVDDVQETSEVDDDQETAKIKELMKIVSDEEEVAIDAIPLATKPPTIVDWKIHKEGKKNYYQIIRVDGSSKMYLVFSHMLKSFDKEDLKLCGSW